MNYTSLPNSFNCVNPGSPSINPAQFGAGWNGINSSIGCAPTTFGWTPYSYGGVFNASSSCVPNQWCATPTSQFAGIGNVGTMNSNWCASPSLNWNQFCGQTGPGCSIPNTLGCFSSPFGFTNGFCGTPIGWNSTSFSSPFLGGITNGLGCNVGYGSNVCPPIPFGSTVPSWFGGVSNFPTGSVINGACLPYGSPFGSSFGNWNGINGLPYGCQGAACPDFTGNGCCMTIGNTPCVWTSAGLLPLACTVQTPYGLCTLPFGNSYGSNGFVPSLNGFCGMPGTINGTINNVQPWCGTSTCAPFSWNLPYATPSLSGLPFGSFGVSPMSSIMNPAWNSVGNGFAFGGSNCSPMFMNASMCPAFPYWSNGFFASPSSPIVGQPIGWNQSHATGSVTGAYPTHTSTSHQPYGTHHGVQGSQPFGNVGGIGFPNAASTVGKAYPGIPTPGHPVNTGVVSPNDPCCTGLGRNAA